MTEAFFKGLMQIRRRIPGASLATRYWSSRAFFNQPVELFGLDFRNPLGLSGMDPDGQFANQLSDYGFGFIVTGPFHPESDNKNLLRTIARLRERPSRTLIAATLARRPGDVRDETVLDDYRIPFSLLYDFVDFFIVRMEAPHLDSISEILDELLELRLCYERFCPILLRIPEKMPPDELSDILSYCMLSGIDGIVAEGVPLIGRVRDQLNGRLPVIGLAQTVTPEDALAMRDAGARLIIMEGSLLRQGRRAAAKVLRTLKNKTNTQP
jgi:dihydroorotate dehydrogenase